MEVPEADDVVLEVLLPLLLRLEPEDADGFLLFLTKRLPVFFSRAGAATKVGGFINLS